MQFVCLPHPKHLWFLPASDIYVGIFNLLLLCFTCSKHWHSGIQLMTVVRLQSYLLMDTDVDCKIFRPRVSYCTFKGDMHDTTYMHMHTYIYIYSLNLVLSLTKCIILLERERKFHNFVFLSQKRGEILIGLCYLPTAERMSVTIVKVTNLNPYFSHGTITKQSKLLHNII